MLRRPVAEFVFEQFVDYEKLAHCFAGGAAFGDYVKHRFFHVDDVKQRRHPFGVDVVLDVKFRAATLFFRQVVVSEMFQSVEYRRRSQRRAAYAQHHESVAPRAHVPGAFEYVFNDFVLIVRQVHPALPAFARLGKHRGSGFGGFGGAAVYFDVRYAVFANGAAHHVVEIECKRFAHKYHSFIL